MPNPMLVPMLKAVSKMLEKQPPRSSQAVGTPSETLQAKVECAKEVLDELILHLEDKTEDKDIYKTLSNRPIVGGLPVQAFRDKSDLDTEAQQAKEGLVD